MAVQDQTAQDVLLEQLAKRVGALAAEQKAKESAIKELNTQIKLAEADSALKIQAAQDAYQAKQLELEAAIAPFLELRHTCEQLKGEIAQLKQAKLDATAEIKAARGGAIKEANDALALANARLAALQTAIGACKETVASL